MADYCLKWSQLPEGYGRDYGIRFGAKSLVEANRIDELKLLLKDPKFIGAKGQACSVREYVRDVELLSGWAVWDVWLSPLLPDALIEKIVKQLVFAPTVPVLEPEVVRLRGGSISEAGVDASIALLVYQMSCNVAAAELDRLRMIVRSLVDILGARKCIARLKAHYQWGEAWTPIGYLQTVPLDELVLDVRDWCRSYLPDDIQ